MKTIKDLDSLIAKLTTLRAKSGNVIVIVSVDQETGPYSHYVDEREVSDVKVGVVGGEKVLQLLV